MNLASYSGGGELAGVSVVSVGFCSGVGSVLGVFVVSGAVCSGVGELVGVGVAVASCGSFVGVVAPSGFVLGAADLMDDFPRGTRWIETGFGLRDDTSIVWAA